MPAYEPLLATSNPTIIGLFYAAVGLYALALAVTLALPKLGRWVTAAGVVTHLACMIMRGAAIGYFPLTNKFESFSSAALALAIVIALTWQPRRLYAVPMLGLLGGLLYAATLFKMDMSFPAPPLITIWYPLHVPLSFLAYAIWAAAACAGLVWWRERDGAWLRRVDRYALQGLGLWSASMIFGGIWGVVAWGAYFLWDPKVIWSVILWFHYAAFVHLRLTPSLRDRPWVRPTLAHIGLLWVFIAYVGTSFFFGGSSHSFE